jgi:MOSC domain-containing protein YiiM
MKADVSDGGEEEGGSDAAAGETGMTGTSNGDVEGRVVGVCVGRVRPLRAKGRIHHTAFVKEPVDGPVALGVLGLEGDEHVYPDHGGPDQSLLVFSADHYPAFRSEYGLDLPAAGAFGENLTVTGLTETEVHIGDTFRIGGTVVQVTSPRSPCYKIGLRYDNPVLPADMDATARTGYLMRTTVAGSIEAGDRMVLVERPSKTCTVAEAARVVNRDRDDWAAVERLITIPELAEAMRDTLAARLDARDPGSADPRLYGEGEGEPASPAEG